MHSKNKKARLLSWVQSFFLSVLIALFLCSPSAAENTQETVPLTIYTQEKRAITFDVEVARTIAQQQRGLMFRQTIPENGGMLFLYAPPRPIQMWMKNTYVPLDMLFVDVSGEIVHIHPMAEPHSLTPIGPEGHIIQAVVELAGGATEKHGIRIGDRIELKEAINAPHQAN